MKMPNKHYCVEHHCFGMCACQYFTSLVKAKRAYKQIKINNGEIKKLRQDKCVLIEDSYINCEWVHKEKGFKTNG